MTQNNSPTISVIMPVYNGAKFLDLAIQSILNQTFSDFEFIIINDGSVDDTEKIILSYKDSRIVYLKNDTNIRLIKTLNKGLAMSKGKYIARMDADDISVKNRFELQIAEFRKFENIDIVNANAFHLEENGRYYRKQRFSINLSSDALKFILPFQNFICHPVIMIKANLIKSFKYVDDISNEHIEDFDLWNRMLSSGYNCYSISENLLFYRDNSSSINHTQRPHQIKRMSKLSASILRNEYNFEFDPTLLPILLDYASQTSFTPLKHINHELIRYINFVKTSFLKEQTHFKELTIWRKKRLTFMAVKGLISKKYSSQLGSLVFLITHLNWFISSELLFFTKNLFLIKKTKFNNNKFL